MTWTRRDWAPLPAVILICGLRGRALFKQTARLNALYAARAAATFLRAICLPAYLPLRSPTCLLACYAPLPLFDCV